MVLWAWFTGRDPQAGGYTAVREGFSFFLANPHNRGETGAAAGAVGTGGGSSSTAAKGLSENKVLDLCCSEVYSWTHGKKHESTTRSRSGDSRAVCSSQRQLE